MYRPTSGLDSPRFVGVRTFMRLPYVTDVRQCDAFVVGIPFDTGATFRVGARFAPEAIRSISAIIRAYHPFHGFDIFDRINVADAGDLAVVPGYAESSLTRVTNQLVAMLEQSNGGVPIVLGGDHTVVLPELRAQVAYRKQPIAVVHFDSHPDTWDEYWGEKYTHGTMYRRAVEEGLIDTAHSIQVGLHGTLYDEDDWGQSRTLGFATLTLRESLDLGMPATIARIRERVGDAPVYLSLDIDVLDPAFAPGTGTPEVGGYTTIQMQELLRGLGGLNYVGFDLVEVLPQYDGPGQTTSLLAANLCWELLALAALRSE
ncbi:MAG TPA: agmatinase [Chloroflexota bacterium]|nr:agmatinase [Chloroflexota bacterium]